MSDTSSSQAGRPRLRRSLRRIIVVLLLALIGGAVAGKYWIIPAVIRSQLAGSLGEVWRGRVDVGKVSFSYFGPIRLGHLRLIDEQDRPWVSLGALELGLDDWPSLSPKLSVVRLASLDVRAHVADGQCDWPFITPPPSDEPVDWQQYVDLTAASIDALSLGAVEADGRGVLWQGYRLTMKRDGGGYRCTLARPDAPDSPELHIDGQLDADDMLDVHVRVDRHLSRAELAAILAAAGAGEPTRASGRLTADVRVRGPARRPEGITAVGPIELNGWDVRRDGAPALRNLRTTIALNGRSAELRDTSAELAGGTIRAGASAHLTDDNELMLSNVTAELAGISMPRLAESISASPVLDRGTLDATIGPLTGRIAPGADEPIEELYGRGRIHIAGANLYATSLIGAIIREVALPLETDLAADADATFGIDRTTITLTGAKQRATLKSRLHTTVINDGTIDLAGKRLDIHVTPISAQQLRRLLPETPGSPLLWSLADHLTQFRVQGRWDRPDELKVRPALLRGAQKGILGGIRGIIRPFEP
ncbi:MAG: hypothetical protein KGY99_06665 [Phycisphaerae bacterium]|nr:hypothetical protein [Phycisphaerae bacterium]